MYCVALFVYSGSPPDHLKKIILTPKRKELILEFRSKDKKNVGSIAWTKRLQKSMHGVDQLVQLGDIERWIKTHPWIVVSKNINIVVYFLQYIYQFLFHNFFWGDFSPKMTRRFL